MKLPRKKIGFLALALSVVLYGVATFFSRHPQSIKGNQEAKRELRGIGRESTTIGDFSEADACVLEGKTAAPRDMYVGSGGFFY